MSILRSFLGRPEVACAVVLIAGMGTAAAEPVLINPPYPDGEVCAIDDFDGDGLDDIAWCDFDGHAVQVVLMNGDEPLVGEPPPTGDWRVIGSGDFTGYADARAELLWQDCEAGGQLTVTGWNAAGGYVQIGSLTPKPCAEPGSNVGFRFGGVGNLDSAGVDDLAWQEAFDQRPYTRVVATRIDYDGSRLTEVSDAVDQVAPNFLNYFIVGLDDFDADGDDDLLVRDRREASSMGFLVYLIKKVYEPGDPDGDLRLELGGALVTAKHTPSIPDYLDPPPDRPVVGVGPALAHGGVDLLVRREDQGAPMVTWRYEIHPQSGAVKKLPVVTHAKKLPPTKFSDEEFGPAGPGLDLYDDTPPDTHFDLYTASIGDFDGDGRQDVLWHGTTPGEEAYWIAFSREPIRGVHFKPHLNTLPPSAGDRDWKNYLSDLDVQQEVAAELDALRATGVTAVHVQWATGADLSFGDTCEPDQNCPRDSEVENITIFLTLLRDRGMRAILNIANHCWLAQDEMDADYVHVGGFGDVPSHACYHPSRPKYEKCKGETDPEECEDAIDPGTSQRLGCQWVYWQMPLCLADPPNSVQELAAIWYGNILASLEGLEDAIAFVDLSGDPLSPDGGEPGVFAAGFYDSSQHQTAIRQYLAAVVPVFTLDYPAVSLGQKFWLWQEPQYSQVENFVAAVTSAGQDLTDFDYFDFTANARLDVDELLLPTRLGEDSRYRIVLADFKAYREPWDGSVWGEFQGNVYRCFFDLVEDRDLAGWWSWEYRAKTRDGQDDSDRMGLRTWEDDDEWCGPVVGEDETYLGSWNERTVEAIQREEGLVRRYVYDQLQCPWQLPYVHDP